MVFRGKDAALALAALVPAAQAQRDIERLQTLQRQFSPMTETYQALCRAVEALQNQHAQNSECMNSVLGEHSK